MIRTSPASLKYAKASFETSSADRVQVVIKDLKAFKAFLEKDPATKEFYLSPIVAFEKKNELIGNLSGVLSPEAVALLKSLCQRGRIALIDEVAHGLQGLADEKNKVLRCEVKSAHPVDADKKNQLEKIIKEKTGKQAEFTYILDKTVLGGIKVLAGGITIDDSIEGHLSKIKEEFKN